MVLQITSVGGRVGLCFRPCGPLRLDDAASLGLYVGLWYISILGLDWLLMLSLHSGLRVYHFGLGMDAGFFSVGCVGFYHWYCGSCWHL